MGAGVRRRTRLRQDEFGTRGRTDPAKVFSCLLKSNYQPLSRTERIIFTDVRPADAVIRKKPALNYNAAIPQFFNSKHGDFYIIF